MDKILSTSSKLQASEKSSRLLSNGIRSHCSTKHKEAYEQIELCAMENLPKMEDNQDFEMVAK